MAFVKFMSNPTLRSRAEAALDSIAGKEARALGVDPLPYVVSAGDAIEAMLADFLIRSSATEQEKAQILKHDLKTLIDDCQAASGISLSTKHLCHGVREMRNLVHPTRAARTGDVISLSHLEAATRVAELVRSELQANTPRPPKGGAEDLWSDVLWNDVLGQMLDELVEALPREERVGLLLEVIPAELAEVDDPDDFETDMTVEYARRFAVATLPRVSKAVRRRYWEWLSQRLREVDRPDFQGFYIYSCFIAVHLNDASKTVRDFLVAYVVTYMGVQEDCLVAHVPRGRRPVPQAVSRRSLGPCARSLCGEGSGRETEGKMCRGSHR